MDLITLLLIIMFLGYRNAARAREKGVNPIFWGVLTAVLFIVGSIIGSMIDLIGILIRHPEYRHAISSGNVKEAQELTVNIQEAMLENSTINGLTIMVCAFGGYLLVRYLLSIKKMPGNKNVA
jgi:hypothetical protein